MWRNIPYNGNVGLIFYGIFSIFNPKSSWVDVNAFFWKNFVCSVSFFYSYYLGHLFFQIKMRKSNLSLNYFSDTFDLNNQPSQTFWKSKLFSYFKNICSSFIFHCYSPFCTKRTEEPHASLIANMFFWGGIPNLLYSLQNHD